MYFIKVVIFISVLLCFSTVGEAKKRCKPLLDKLHKVQAMQRKGYSSQRGISLRAKEDKARDTWWQCEQGRKIKQKKKSKKKKTQSNYSNASLKRSTSKKIAAGTPFKTNNIVIKSKYQGNKKQAWFKFYQQPTRCSRPKSLAVFASCSENKKAQRIKFEQEYK
jgi:hypothetical protein